MRLGAIYAVTLLGGVVACDKPRPVEPAPVTFPPMGSEESDPALCPEACANLARVGCREGASRACADVCARSSRLLAWPLKCWATKETRDELVACGGVRCAVTE